MLPLRDQQHFDGKLVRKMHSIAICIATLKRPNGLDRLLKSLSGLTFENRCPIIEICIADNDPQKSAEKVVEKWKGLMQWQITYEVESEPGIPFVRNKLICMAKNSDFIAFIDDDEIASPQWLDELFNIQEEYDADVVMGPVIPAYEISPPDWVVKGGFHASGRFKDGLTDSNLITGNLLIRQSLFKKFQLTFEERMALTGGTDVLLGRFLKRFGVKFYWSDRAVVEAIIPLKRMQIKWLLLRRFRGGIVEALNRRYLKERYFRLESLFAAVRFIIIGILKTFTFIWNGKCAAVKGVGYIIQGIGMISCLLGVSYEEYKSAHR